MHTADGQAGDSFDEGRFLKTVLDAAPGMIAYWDSNLRCRHANRAYLEWFGKAPEQVVGMYMADLLGERLFRLNEPFIRGALMGKPQRFERTLTKADGSIGYTLANYVPDVNDDGLVMGFSVLVSDVTPLKLAEFQIEKAQARLQAVLDSVADAIFTLEADGTVSSSNPAALSMFGWRSEQLLGRPLQWLIDDLSGRDGLPADVRQQLPLLVGTPRELTARHADGHRFPIELRLARVDTPGENRYVGVARDVTLQRQVHDQLTRLAMQDGLTGLANRRHFDEVLLSEFHSHMRSGQALSLVMIDVDFFKQFNDRYGHVAGDECLRRIAAALRRAITRTTDLPARYGGEEFACILPMTGQAGALQIARHVQEEVARLAIEHDRSTVAGHVTVSMGIATAHCTSDLCPEAVVRMADAQLYAAKQQGRNRVAAARLA